MTAENAVDLLITYGDALEAAHPAPGAISSDSSESMFVPDDLSGIDIEALDMVKALEEESRRPRLLLALVAAVVALLVFIGVRALTGESDVRTADIPDGGVGSSFVFPGEIVLREEPLVVIANQPAEPTFDTGELGRRIVHQSPLDLDDAELDSAVEEVIDTLTRPFLEQTGTEIRRVAIHGLTDAGPLGVAIVDSEEATGVVRWRLVIQPGGGSIAIDPIDAAPDVRPADTYAEHVADNLGQRNFSIGGGGAEEGVGVVTIELEVPLDIAVVQIIIEGEGLWTVPIDGLTYLTPTMALDTQFELVTYDVDGNEVTRQLGSLPTGFDS